MKWKLVTPLKNVMIQHKPHFQLAKSGLIISAEFPFIFKQRDNYISEAAENDNFYLIKTNNNRKLLVIHQYCYQIETQIHVTKSNFCDFFVWTKKDYHVERIYPNANLWSEILSQCNRFFKYVFDTRACWEILF